MTSPANTWVKPHRLDYLPLNDRLAVVRLSAQLTCDGWPRYPGLVVGAPHTSMRTLALGSVTSMVPRRRVADELLWRVTFAVPLELVQCPQALFGLVAAGYSANRLPDPWLATLAALSEPWPAGDRYHRFIGTALARRAAALGTALAVVGSGYAGPLAAAASGKGAAQSARAVVLAPRQASGRTQSPAESMPAHPAASADRAQTPSGSGAKARSSATPRSLDQGRPADRAHQAHRAAATSSSSRAGSRTGGVVLSRPHPADAATLAHRSAPHPGAGHERGSGSHHHRHVDPARGAHDSGSVLTMTPPAGLSAGDTLGYQTGHDRPGGQDRHSHNRQGGTGAERDHRHPGGERREHRHPGGAHHHASGGAGLPKPQPARPPQPTPTPPPAPAPAPAPGTSSASSPSSGASSWTSGEGSNSSLTALLRRLSGITIGTRQPPSFLIPIYERAGAKYHIPWQVLAAINYIETDYGRDLNVSPAGAVGWMQFMPSTWREYGIAVGHSGPPNPNNPTDAIFSAARYLAANGGAKHLRQAIFAYNHAGWYVEEVILTAAQILEHTPRPGTSAKAKIAAMKTAARLLNGLPYVYGGGHAGWGPSVGYDCSGFVSAVLHAAGYLTAPVDTQTLPYQPRILSGPGKWVTIFDRTNAGSLSEDHVIIDIDGQFWESGGSTTSGGAPQVHQIKQMSLAYLATFNRILHPQGL